MSLISRTLRNIARSKVRTIGLILVVSVCLGAFLILSQIGSDVDANVDAARAAVANVITVQGAGSSGFFGDSTHISGTILSTVRYTPGVDTAQRILLEAPGLNSSGSGGGGPPPGGGGRFNFTLYEGIDTTGPISLFGGFGGGSSLSIVSGRTLNATDEGAHVVLVGESFASDHDVSVGNSISVNGTGMTVVGIFQAGSGGGFGDHNVILPFPAAQTAFAASGPNLIYVTVYSSDNVSSVVELLQEELGSDYSVTALGQTIGGGFASSISSILSGTEIEEYAALAVGAAVVVVVMVIVTSQRIREIGLLKAFGFTNASVLAQLLTESVLVSLAGLPLALALTVWAGPTVANEVLGSSAGGFGGRRFGGFAGGFFGRIDFSITPEVLLLGIAVTLAFGVVGAAYPILRAVRLKPSEILRHE